MNNTPQENPPREDTVESFEDTRELFQDKKTVESKIEEVFEKAAEVHPGKDLTDEEKEKIEALKKELSVDTMIDKVLQSKDTGEEPLHEKTEQPLKQITGLKKIGVAIGLFFAGLTGAKAQETKTDNIDLGKAHKIAATPTDPSYKPYKTEGNKNYYLKESEQLAMATPNSLTGDPTAYMNTMIEKVKSGISPQELLRSKRIDPTTAKNLMKYYNPDLVYTETGPKTQEFDPFSIFAKGEQPLYGANQHAFGTMYWPTRSTESIEVAGNRGESESDIVAIIFENEGVPTGKRAIIDLKGKIDEKYGPQFAGKMIQDLFSGTHATSPQTTQILEDLADEYAKISSKTAEQDISAKNLSDQNSVVKN